MTCLWYRERGGEIDDEIGLQVPDGNLSSVHDELATAENPRTRCDKSGPELHDHVEEVEEICDGAKERDGDAQAVVGGEAGGAADGGEVEVERVDEESNEGGDEEDLVPVADEVAVWVEDLVLP